MNDKLRWICEKDKIEMDALLKVEEALRIRFPKDYIEFIITHDGAYPIPNIFEINGNEEVFNNLLSFDEESCINIVDTYNDVQDRLIEKIIPFAEDPFGNLICFDYRNKTHPTIVFWDHEKAFSNKENAISYICNTFSELLDMLRASEE